MLTAEQEEWLNHLSDTNIVSIIPFNPTSEDKFLKVKTLVQALLGPDQLVRHCGSSSFGISGQDEIDIFIPTSLDKFEQTVELMKQLFGQPKSNYHLRRVRFMTEIDGKHVDVFVINESSDDWQNSLKFETILKDRPEILERYKTLKEKQSGQNVREYYRQKIEFINEVLGKN